MRLDRQHGLGLEGAVESVVAWDRVLGIRFDRPRNLNGDPAWSAGTVRLIDGSEFAYLSVSFEAARLIFRLPGSALVDTPIAAIQEWRLGPSAGETPFPTSDAASDVVPVPPRVQNAGF